MPASPSSRDSWLTRERVVLAGLLAFTLVVRGGVLFALREKLVDDPDAYRRIAENLLADGTFSMDEPKEFPELSPSVRTPNPQKAPWKTPTAYRPPLYPVVLSNLAAADQAHVSLGKVAGLHLLLGVGTVWLTWLTARRLRIGNCKLQIANWGASGGRKSPEVDPPREAMSWWAEPTLRMPLVAGIVVACDPILLNQSALVMTETLATFLAVLSLWCLARFDSQRSWFNAGLVGGAMGLAVLCRPTFLPWVGVVASGMLLVRGQIENFKLQECKLQICVGGCGLARCELCGIGGGGGDGGFAVGDSESAGVWQANRDDDAWGVHAVAGEQLRLLSLAAGRQCWICLGRRQKSIEISTAAESSQASVQAPRFTFSEEKLSSIDNSIVEHKNRFVVSHPLFCTPACTECSNSGRRCRID